MRIQVRLALLLAAVVAGFALTTWSLNLSDTRQTRRLMENIRRERETLFDHLLALTGKPLQLFAQDYSVWDDMVAFVRTRDPAWAKVNIQDSLTTLKIDAAWVLQSDFAPVYAVNGLESDRLKTLPVPPGELAAVTAADVFPHFFLETPAGFLEVRGAPIQPSSDTARRTPPQGWFFAARIWDESCLKTLGGLTESDVSLSPGLQETTGPNDLPDSINLHRTLPDWRGRALRTLHSHHHPPAIGLLQAQTRQKTWMLAAFGAVVTGLLYFGTARWVARPLRALRASLVRHDTAPLADLKTNASEFGQLARLVESSFAQQAALQREIDERTRAEGARRESEARYRQLFENSQLGIYRTTPDGRILEANPALIAMFGYASFGELAALNLERDGYAPRYSRSQFKQLMDRDGVVRGLEFEWAHANGRIMVLRENARAIRDAAGVTQWYEGTVEDITERRRAEEERQQLLALLNAIADIVLINDVPGLRFIYANEGAVKQLGYSRAELLTMTPADIDTAARLETMREANAAFARGESPTLTLDTRYRRKDGRIFPVEVHIQYYAPPDGPAVCLAVARDATERKAIEQQRLRAQRLDSIGTLAGGVAHDLNNVFTPLMMVVDELRGSHTAPDPELIDMFDTNVKRGAAMVRQLLTFGRGIEGERLLLQPHHLVKDIARIINSTFPKSIQFETQFDKNLWPVTGDATQLHQVILNLCVNARDAMPEGGTLTLALRNLAVTPANAAAWPDTRPGRYALLEIQDTGAGIPPEIMDRLFEPFFTTKPPDKGTGLGLSTALSIVRSHGGTIQVASEVGRGSSFRVLLPAVAGDVASAHPLPPETYDGRGRLVLLVDDEKAIRSATTKTLTKMGFRVLEAVDGGTALDQCDRHKHELQLIITDLHMPETNGLALVQSLRLIGTPAAIIAMSGRFEDRLNSDLAALNVASFLDKPFTRQQFVAALRQALD